MRLVLPPLLVVLLAPFEFTDGGSDAGGLDVIPLLLWPFPGGGRTGARGKGGGGTVSFSALMACKHYKDLEL